MAKKKAIKLATATAIAASAFAAAAPVQTSAAVNVDTVVKNAVKKMAAAQNSFVAKASDKKLVDVKTVQANQVAATKEYTAAKAIVKKSGGKNTAALNAKLDAAKKTMDYRINNFVTARKEVSALAVANQAVKKAEAAQLEAKVKELEAQLAKTEAVVAKVIGASTRDKMTAVSVTPSKATLEKAKAELAIAKVASVTVVNETTVTVKLETAKTGLDAKNFKVLVDGTAVTPSAVVADATGANYTLTVASLKDKAGKVTVNGKESAYDFTAPKVVGVSAINATQVEVKFNKAVDPASVFADGKSGAIKGTNVTLTSLDGVTPGTLAGTLSADGKTLTVTAQNPLSKRYDVVVDGVKTTDDKTVAKYAEMITIAADTTAPVITGTEQISPTQVKIKFSEPVKAHTGILKYADGTDVTGATVTVAEGATEVVVDLSNNAVLVNKPITATFIGLQDKAGNLVTPHPATVQIIKQQVDGVKPAVSSINQTGVKTFNIKFSKDVVLPETTGVINTNNVTVSGGYAVSSIEKVTNSEYKVTVDKNLTGVLNVTVNAGFKDLSNQAGDAVTKVVTFSSDAVAPKAISSKVVIGSDNNEYLELTYDKDVTEGKLAISGSYVKDYVTSPVASIDVDATYASKTSKQVLRVKLSSFATVKGAAYKVDVVSAGTGGVTSISGVNLEKASASFTRGEDGSASNTNKLAAPTLAAPTNDTVTVTFTGQVDGASATNIANYKIDGAVIESATLAEYNSTAGTQVVTLKLKDSSNAFTGVRNISVENVKALGSSVTMDKFVKNDLILTENVRPTVTKVVLTANNEITLTFSEAVYDATNVAAEDFDLYVGGTKSTITLTTENVAQNAAKNTIKLTLSGAVNADDLAKGLTIKAASKLDVKDAKDNALTFTSAGVTQ